jgi:hypothetical protein
MTKQRLLSSRRNEWSKKVVVHLSDSVVDFVGASVVEVLPLEPNGGAACGSVLGHTGLFCCYCCLCLPGLFPVFPVFLMLSWCCPSSSS